jgi:8-oxo-dGTP pyrophosphatase MutT (NUDIX family)
MKLLGEISEKSLGISETEILGKKYTLRKSARCVLLNDKNEVSLQFVGKNNYYKLPGGGVDEGETEKDALVREIIEEVGCDITIEQELGIIIEYRDAHELIQISYGYIARVKGDIREPEYTQSEIDDGFEAVWKPVDEAIVLLENHCPKEPYQIEHIVAREKMFLKEAVKILE